MVRGSVRRCRHYVDAGTLMTWRNNIEERRAYHRAYWRRTSGKRNETRRAAYQRLNAWCVEQHGITFGKLRMIRASLREQARVNGQNFLELARRNNALLKGECNGRH
jgi:hypothetical protein